MLEYRHLPLILSWVRYGVVSGFGVFTGGGWGGERRLRVLVVKAASEISAYRGPYE